MVADLIGTDSVMVLAPMLPGMEQIKDVKGSFESLSWLFWSLFPNSRNVSPFQEKEIPAHFSKKPWLKK